MTYIPSRDEVESALAKASSIDPLACEVRRRAMTVDEILGRVTIEVDPHIASLKEGSTGMALVQLGAEVRRLRELVARVAALPDKWKGRIIGDDWTGAALQLEGALNDAARRLERAHDEADKYQVRALDAEAEVRRLRDELEEERANSLAAGRYVRPALKDEP